VRALALSRSHALALARSRAARVAGTAAATAAGVMAGLPVVVFFRWATGEYAVEGLFNSVAEAARWAAEPHRVPDGQCTRSIVVPPPAFAGTYRELWLAHHGHLLPPARPRDGRAMVSARRDWARRT
jgi:hypothetical protein